MFLQQQSKLTILRATADLKKVLESPEAATKMTLKQREIQEICRLLDDVVGLPPPEVRRASLSLTSKDAIIPEEEEDPSDSHADHHPKKEEENDPGLHKQVSRIAKLFPKWEPPDPSVARVSFSCFILALRQVCAEQCMSQSRATSVIMRSSVAIGSGRPRLGTGERSQDLSEYLK